MDAKNWLMFLFAVAANAPNGGLTTFQGLIIRGPGFSTLRTTLIQMPSGGVQFVMCVSACFVASSYENARFTVMLVCLVPMLAGVLGMWLLPQTNAYDRIVCLWITFSYTASWSLSISVVTANTAGHTTKATSAAMLLIGYCLGNFIGPFFLISRQAPRYEFGVVIQSESIHIRSTPTLLATVVQSLITAGNSEVQTPSRSLVRLEFVASNDGLLPQQ